MHKDPSRRKFDIVMAWSVDRLGRSLQDLIGFLSELHSLGRADGSADKKSVARLRPIAALFVLGVLLS
ncbi:MAG TPA: recombinase family protein [Pseudolabrys sp.]